MKKLLITSFLALSSFNLGLGNIISKLESGGEVHSLSDDSNEVFWEAKDTIFFKHADKMKFYSDKFLASGRIKLTKYMGELSEEDASKLIAKLEAMPIVCDEDTKHALVSQIESAMMKFNSFQKRDYINIYNRGKYKVIEGHCVSGINGENIDNNKKIYSYLNGIYFVYNTKGNYLDKEKATEPYGSRYLSYHFPEANPAALDINKLLAHESPNSKLNFTNKSDTTLRIDSTIYNGKGVSCFLMHNGYPVVDKFIINYKHELGEFYITKFYRFYQDTINFNLPYPSIAVEIEKTPVHDLYRVELYEVKSFELTNIDDAELEIKINKDTKIQDHTNL